MLHHKTVPSGSQLKRRPRFRADDAVVGQLGVRLVALKLADAGVGRRAEDAVDFERREGCRRAVVQRVLHDVDPLAVHALREAAAGQAAAAADADLAFDLAVLVAGVAAGGGVAGHPAEDGGDAVLNRFLRDLERGDRPPNGRQAEDRAELAVGQQFALDVVEDAFVVDDVLLLVLQPDAAGAKVEGVGEVDLVPQAELERAVVESGTAIRRHGFRSADLSG